MNTETKPKITPRPLHTLEPTSFIITFKEGLSPNNKNQVLSLFETTPREGVTIDRNKMTVIVEGGYIERHESKPGITNLITPCGLSYYPSQFVESATYLDGTPIR